MTARIIFGQWLKMRRKKFDITREELAERIGCAAVTLYKIEIGERRPSKQIAQLLAEHLNIPGKDHAAFVDFARVGTFDSPAAVPWGTPFHPPTNLPVPPTPLIGRDQDIKAVCRQLLQPEARLFTLVGPPGIGKTRLALQAAAHVLDDFGDGVYWVGLIPITDDKLVLTTIATTLGVHEAGPQTSVERLKVFLRDKQVLLVLDNLEQILTVAPQIAELLAACPLLKILATSRAPLRIRQERQILVSPLVLPDLACLPDVEGIAQYSAVMLFIERAQAVKPDFTLTQQNASAVAALCSRLDGLPLAIELISARVKLLPPAALLERLNGGLMLRSDGLRDMEPRHRTLNAAIDWSYQLLNPEEQTLLRRLGIFAGGWTLEAAQAICMADLDLNVVDGLGSLLDKNLVKQEMQSDVEPRFTLLETIREYALEQLTASGERETLQQQHANYFVIAAEQVESGHKTSQRLSQKLDRLEIELPNLRAAWTWCQQTGDNETLLRLTMPLIDFWLLRGHLSEGRTWLIDALKATRSAVPTRLTTDDLRRLRAAALSQLGVLHQWQGDLDAAQAYHEESVTIYRELEDPAGVANALGTYGMLFVLREDIEHAGPILEESLALWRSLNNLHEVSSAIFFLGTLAYLEGKTNQADQHWEESINGLRMAGDDWMLAIALAHHAMIALDQGRYEQAHARLTESLKLLREMRESWQVVHTLEVSACLAVFQGQHSGDKQLSLLRSARIFGAAERLREVLSAPVMSFQRRSHEDGVAALHAQLDEVTLASAWAEGRRMTLEQAVDYVLSE